MVRWEAGGQIHADFDEKAAAALPAGPVMKYPVKTNTKEADSPQA